MYFNRDKKPFNNNNRTIPIVGLGALLLTTLAFYQINYSRSFVESPKELRIYLDLEFPDRDEDIIFSINNEDFELSNINHIDSLLTCTLIPNKFYTIKLSVQHAVVYQKQIKYVGEPNLMVHLKFTSVENNLVIETEEIELFMNLRI